MCECVGVCVRLRGAGGGAGGLERNPWLASAIETIWWHRDAHDNVYVGKYLDLYLDVGMLSPMHWAGILILMFSNQDSYANVCEYQHWRTNSYANVNIGIRYESRFVSQ